MPENSKLTEWIDTFEMKALADAYVDSANRSRYVILVMIVASVLAFIAYWNSRPSSYIHERMQTARYAYKHMVFELIDLDPLSADSLCRIWALTEMVCLHLDTTWSNTKILSNYESLREVGLSKVKAQYNTDSLARHSLSKKQKWTKLDDSTIATESNRIVQDLVSKQSRREKALLVRAQGLCKHRMFNKSDRLQQFLQYLERVHVERVLMFQIPIFGVVVDVNDLGFFSGFAFTLILIWFRFSLRKEYTNLKTVFEKAREKGKLEQCYDYLAMRQMLTLPWTAADPPTVPFTPDRSIRRFGSYVKEILFRQFPMLFMEKPERSRRKYWICARTLLFCMPVVVQFLVLYNDALTLDVGSISKSAVEVLMWFIIGILLFIVVSILTVRCISLSCLLDKEWDNRYEEIVKSSSQDQEDKA
jgi:hypothetical protein